MNERFVIAVPTRQGAMEQCSRATKRYRKRGLRFVVVMPFPPHGWLVERVPPLPGKYAPPGSVEARRLAEARTTAKPKAKRQRDPLAHIYELLDRPEPWESE